MADTAKNINLPHVTKEQGARSVTISQEVTQFVPLSGSVGKV